MEKTKFQELNQLSPDKRNGDKNYDRRKERKRNFYSYFDRRKEFRRKKDEEEKKILSMDPSNYEDKHGKPGEKINLFKNNKEE